jgi:hypothetical protein
MAVTDVDPSLTVALRHASTTLGVSDLQELVDSGLITPRQADRIVSRWMHTTIEDLRADPYLRTIRTYTWLAIAGLEHATHSR